MKILSWRMGEIVVESAGFCRFLKTVGLAVRVPRAMAQWPFLVVRNSEEAKLEWLMNHERIHFAQQRETLVVGLILLTLLETMIARLWLGKTAPEAYFWRATEQEAYLNQNNLDYLATRRAFAVLRYLRHKRRFRVTDVPGEIEFY